MTRLLLVTNIFPPEVGGPAVFIDRLAHALVDRGHTPTVVCSADDVPAGFDGDRPFRVRRVDMSNRYRYEIVIRLVLFVELLRHRRILVNGLEGYVGPLARLLGRRYVLKIVGDTVWETARNQGLTVCGFDEFQDVPKEHPRLRSLADARRRYLARARMVITPSRYLAGVVERWGVPASRLRVVPNGVPFIAESPVPERTRRALRVVFCGRFTNWKGVETLLLAARGLEGIEVSLVGSGPEAPMLWSLAKQLGYEPDRLFAGRLPPDEVSGTLARHHVLVLMSAYEGLSHTLLEAAALGLVPVVSDVGGNAEIIRSGENGLLVPLGAADVLRQHLIDLRDDEPLRARLAAGARQLAAEHDFARTVAATVALLET